MPASAICTDLRVKSSMVLTGLDDEGEQARDELSAILGGLDEAAGRFEEKRETHHAKLTARGQQIETV